MFYFFVKKSFYFKNLRGVVKILNKNVRSARADLVLKKLHCVGEMLLKILNLAKATEGLAAALQSLFLTYK